MEYYIDGCYRITERQNDLGKHIDVTPISYTLNSFRTIDSQLFRGYSFYDSVYQPKIVSRISQIASEVSNDRIMVFSGCGTSGRIGWLCYRNINRVSKRKMCDYIIAGGDKALIKTQEASEDFPKLGKEELDKVIVKNIDKKYLLVAITCGLSALFVGGQLEYFSDNYYKDLKSVLIGFNTSYQARDTNIPYWIKGSFKNVLNEIIDNKDFYLLNPIVGPEAIQGSSRLKGGSMTKILIEIVYAVSTLNIDNVEKREKKVVSYLHEFEKAYQYAYEDMGKIQDIIQKSGESLKNKNGHVYYLGVDTAGILGLIDASECIPTFGAEFEDIRGFVYKGWKIMDNHNGEIHDEDDCYNISFGEFEKKYLNQLNKNDTIILLSIEGQDKNELNELRKLYTKIKTKKSSIFMVHISSMLEENPKDDSIDFLKRGLKNDFVDIRIPKIEIIPGLKSYGEFALKLVVNNISTIAHVIKGTTYENIMINLRLSNTKLVQRAINIIVKLFKVEEKVARYAVLKAIYEDTDFSNKTINDHVDVAVTKSSVIPIAVLLIKGKCKSVQEAKYVLSKEPILRNVISKYMNAQSQKTVKPIKKNEGFFKMKSIKSLVKSIKNLDFIEFNN